MRRPVSSLGESKGVEFKIGTAVQECRADGVTVGKKDEEPEEIKSQTVVWAAGVRGHPIVEEAGFENMRGRVKVTSFLPCCTGIPIAG